jgi:hypothetical protein
VSISSLHPVGLRTDKSTSYLDLYSSTNPEDVSFFGDLSVVVHYANKTRITCANFKLISSPVASSGHALPTGTGLQNSTLPSGTGSVPSGTLAPTFTSAAPTQPSDATALPTSGANKMMAGAGIVAGLVAMIL